MDVNGSFSAIRDLHLTTSRRVQTFGLLHLCLYYVQFN